MAAEMAQLNLRGTDLVVLSACDTATGKSLGGEGILGMRRALAAAGATNVILTLWPIADDTTAKIIDKFYERYFTGVPAPRAMAEIQQELLPELLEEYDAPDALFLLAPFLCTGLVN